MKSIIYRLKITLEGIRPPIWRRLEVPGSTTLAELHDVFQTVCCTWTELFQCNAECSRALNRALEGLNAAVNATASRDS